MKNAKRFSAQFDNAINTAIFEAQQCGADAVTPAHLFLGLMDEGSGISCDILKKILEIDKDLFRIAIHKRNGMYSSNFDETPDFSVSAMSAFESVQEIAGNKEIDSYQLLLVLLGQCSSGTTELTLALRDAGYNPVDVHESVRRLIKGREDLLQESLPGRKPAPRTQTRIGPAPALPEALAKYGKDLTALAESGQLDPVVGRDKEIHRAICTLLRRRKSNPCFVGKAGVGKSAVAEGLAQRIAAGQVPPQLRNCRIIELNVGAMVSGTKYRGDFEERVTSAIKEASKDSRFILFFDEMHTLLDGGGAESSGMNASNILKPSLARGAIRVIGATTLEEYRSCVEKDPALERRFQCISIEEPSVEQTVNILSHLRTRYEDHHGITIEDDAIRAAAEMSARYINGRQLPDKAVDVIDETASMLQLQNKFQMSKEDIASIIAEIVGIPVGSISEDEGKRLVSLEARLHERIVGQYEAVSAVARAIRRNRAGLNDATRPVGSFLFLGPTGVGKTELSLALSDALYLHKKALIRLDMSEYMENSSVSKIIGAAPGYVGFDSCESLTEKITRTPYAVLLFDEIEKAHPEVWNILLQILDAGTLTDATGRPVSFKNATVIVTSNIGAQHLVSPAKPLGFSSSYTAQTPAENVVAELRKTFRPELLNRFDEIIVFDKLAVEDAVQITRKMTQKLAKKAKEAGLTLTFTEEAIRALAEKGFDPAYGARPLRRIIQREVEDELANLMLAKEVETGDHIECGFDDIFRFSIRKIALTL